MNLNDEIICGHFVSAQKKRANAMYLEMLHEFDRLAKKANITYWVFAGALIGAVRHKGFIPWDDDIDLLVPRKDFDRLLRMSNEAFGAKEPYFLQTPRTDPSFQQRILRFRRSDTSYITQYDLDMIEKAGGKPYNLGLALAIFPLDNWPKSRLLQTLQLKMAKVGVDYRTDGGQVKKKPLLNAMMKLASAVMSEKMVVNTIHNIYRLCPKNRSGLVHCFNGFYPKWDVWPIECFADTVMLPFEDTEVPAPIGYDEMLAISYHNYMDLPPMEGRTEKHEDFMSADIPYTKTLEMLASGELVLPGK